MVEEFLPLGLPTDTNKPYVLITSLNNLEWRSTRVNIKTLPLIDFIDTEAMEFVKKALEIKNDLQNENIVNLAKKLHNLPLALQQAVAYIKEEDRKLKDVDSEKEFKISDYLKEYERKTEDLLKSEVFQKIGNDYDKTIFTALQVTLDKIKNNKEYGQQALEIINIMAYFATDNISAKMFLELISGDERQLGSVIQLLKQYSVVRQDGVLSVHGLVQQVIRLELEKQQEKGKSLEEMTLEKALVLLKKHMRDRNNVDGYIPHIISVWNYANKYDKLIESFIVNDIVDNHAAHTTYFHLITGSSNYGVVNTILSKIKDPKKLHKVVNARSEDKKTPLHLAAQNGHLEIVNVLLDKGPDINAKTKYEFTPLHLAAENNHLKVVKALLKNSRINVNVETEYKFTPLHLAAKKGHLEIAKTLLDNGANIDALDNGHFMPLHLAVQNGHLEVVNVLLDKGANINAQTTKGNTALHLAAENNHLKVVKALITKSANIDIENEEGKTALNLATERDNSEVKDYIRQQTMFNRRPGTSGISGQLYEIKLSMLFLLQGIMKKEDKKINSFHLATNVKEAGDFDDVVFKYESGTEKSKIVFLQAKHRENPEKDKITIEQLFSESEKGDFNLKKYFNSYRKVKQQFSEGREDKIFGSKFEDVDLIIYTNAVGTFSKNKGSVEKVAVEQNSILNLSEKSSSYYKLIASGESNRKRISVLQYSSDCKRLARELAESIFSKQGIVVNEGILRDYHIPLAGEVIQKKEEAREGNLRESFLNSDSQFRSAFFEEVRKRSEFARKSEDELKLELRSKSIKLPDNFGKSNTRKGKYPESLPNDLVSEGDIKEFLSKLKLFVDQSSEEDLGKAIKLKIQEVYKVAQQDIDSVFSDIEYKVRKWWQTGSEYLTENNRFFQDAARISIKFDVKEPVTLFTGRIRELEDLHKILKDGGEAVISQMASVTGLGGIGKSELARKYISEHNKDIE